MVIEFSRNHPEQPSASSKDALVNERIKVQMVENVMLIWLDQNIDEKSTDCQNSISQLRCAVNTINTFTDGEQCIQFLEDIHNEKACVVISGAFDQHIVPRIHNMSQVDSIFIFCGNKKHHEQWAKDWCKIKGIFTEIKPICDVLKQAAQQCERNAISISIIGADGDVSKQNLDQLDPSFMYTQIMKEILLTINFEQQHFEEFIIYCHAVLTNNEGQLKNVDKLERKYRDQTPIWWYTLECFLYPMLNRALRLVDVDLIIKLGFFIGDLHRQIEQLHKEQFDGSSSKKSFSVYRGQGMGKEKFKEMTRNQGGLLSFNCFLSTSKKLEHSLFLADSNQANPALVGILFVMTIDPSTSSTPYASVDGISQFPEEEEVLFSMHTIFRIGNITPIGENDRLFQVELTLTNDNDNDLRQLTDRIREETFPDTAGWYRLGQVLLKMGHPEEAQRIYEILLEQRTEESEKASIYNQLGRIKVEQGEYEEAIRFYEKDLEIIQKSLPPNHPDLAIPYNNIGIVYRNLGDDPKALSSYEKALAIQQQSLPPNHPSLGTSYSNIGIVYRNVGDYPKALSFCEKAITIRQQSLPQNHPDLAMAYNNIGVVYDNMSDYPKALLSYEEALAIQQQTLPPNHLDLAMSYNNIGIVCDNMGDYPKALSSHEKALAIKQQAHPSNHPDLAISHYNIGLLYENMRDYSKACSSYERAVEIGQNSLPTNHPHLRIYQEKLADVKKN